MPNKVINSSPSLSILQRMGLTDKPNPEFDSRMELAQNKMRREMPNEMRNANIQPSGLLGGLKDKMLGGTTVATTGPFGGIGYNKDLLSKMSQGELEDTLAHELTHVGQLSQPGVNGAAPTLSAGQGIMNFFKGFLPPATATSEGLPEYTKRFYSSRGHDPDYRGKVSEMEAFQKEDTRRMNRGDILRPGEDIQLFPPKKNTGINTGSSKR